MANTYWELMTKEAAPVGHPFSKTFSEEARGAFGKATTTAKPGVHPFRAAVPNPNLSDLFGKAKPRKWKGKLGLAGLGLGIGAGLIGLNSYAKGQREDYNKRVF